MTSQEMAEKIDKFARECLPQGSTFEETEAFASLLLGRAVGMFHEIANEDQKMLHNNLCAVIGVIIDSLEQRKPRPRLKLVPK